MSTIRATTATSLMLRFPATLLKARPVSFTIDARSPREPLDPPATSESLLALAAHAGFGSIRHPADRFGDIARVKPGYGPGTFSNSSGKLNQAGTVQLAECATGSHELTEVELDDDHLGCLAHLDRRHPGTDGGG